MTRVVFRNACAIGLLGLGLIQLVGRLTGIQSVEMLGAASAASPLPLVFTAIGGYETFASSFELRFQEGARRLAVPLTPQRYKGLRGPYRRRNAYGAALAFGPVLPERIWNPVLCRGLGRGGPLRRELAIPQEAKGLHVVIRSRTAGRTDEVWTLVPACDR